MLRLLASAEKRSITNLDTLLDEEETENLNPKKAKLNERPKGVKDISSFFKKI